MESGREQNYWPGFVDALSNVVLTLVFVLVIFVFALAMASNKVEQKMQEVTEAAAASKGGASSEAQENQDLKKQLAILNEELEKAHSASHVSDRQATGAVNQQAVAPQNQDKQITVDDKHVDIPHQGPVDVTHLNNGIVLKYPLSVAEMDETSAKQLGDVLGSLQKSVGKHKIIMHSIIGRETYSVARRMAYYRAVNARNFLIAKMGEPPDNISITFVTPDQPEDGRVEIILQKE